MEPRELENVRIDVGELAQILVSPPRQRSLFDLEDASG
jgi:hypothetical protein